jgi:hypothetical protein
MRKSNKKRCFQLRKEKKKRCCVRVPEPYQPTPPTPAKKKKTQRKEQHENNGDIEIKYKKVVSKSSFITTKKKGASLKIQCGNKQKKKNPRYAKTPLPPQKRPNKLLAVQAEK